MSNKFRKITFFRVINQNYWELQYFAYLFHIVLDHNMWEYSSKKFIMSITVLILMLACVVL